MITNLFRRKKKCIRYEIDDGSSSNDLILQQSSSLDDDDDDDSNKLEVSSTSVSGSIANLHNGNEGGLVKVLQQNHFPIHFTQQRYRWQRQQASHQHHRNLFAHQVHLPTGAQQTHSMCRILDDNLGGSCNNSVDELKITSQDDESVDPSNSSPLSSLQSPSGISLTSPLTPLHQHNEIQSSISTSSSTTAGISAAATSLEYFPSLPWLQFHRSYHHSTTPNSISSLASSHQNITSIAAVTHSARTSDKAKDTGNSAQDGNVAISVT